MISKLTQVCRIIIVDFFFFLPFLVQSRFDSSLVHDSRYGFSQLGSSWCFYSGMFGMWNPHNLASAAGQPCPAEYSFTHNKHVQTKELLPSPFSYTQHVKTQCSTPCTAISLRHSLCQTNSHQGVTPAQLPPGSDPSQLPPGSSASDSPLIGKTFWIISLSFSLPLSYESNSFSLYLYFIHFDNIIVSNFCIYLNFVSCIFKL